MRLIFVFCIIFFLSINAYAENKKIIIPFKEMSSFQACYAFMIGTNDLEKKSMLEDWIKIKDINCNQYAEVIYRAKILGNIK